MSSAIRCAYRAMNKARCVLASGHAGKHEPAQMGRPPGGMVTRAYQFPADVVIMIDHEAQRSRRSKSAVVVAWVMAGAERKK